MFNNFVLVVLTVWWYKTDKCSLVYKQQKNQVI